MSEKDVPPKSKARLRLVHLTASSLLPRKRGWYRIDFAPATAAAGSELLFDFGMGLNRHHSVSLPDCGGASFVRVPRAVQATAIVTDAVGPPPVINFAPISYRRCVAEWLADVFVLAVTFTFRLSRQSARSLVVRWRMSGLQVVPAAEARFPARSYYDLWRERYSRDRLLAEPVIGMAEVRAEDLGHLELNQLLHRNDVHWIGIIRNGVRVEADAFACLLRTARTAHAQVAYADNDQLDARGNRCHPHFRTAFSPERLLSEDWLGPLLLIEAAAARDVGGWRESAGDALHYDLCLRLLEKHGPAAFAHAPAILCSQTRQTAPPADVGKVRAAAIKTAGLPLSAFGLLDAISPMQLAQHFTVIIPTRDRLELLRPAVESVFEISASPPGEVIVVDNGSTAPETRAWLNRAIDEYPNLKVLRDPRPFNFSRLNNDAARVAQGRILAFLNNDTLIRTPAWLDLCGALAIRAGIGCVGPLLTYPNGRVQHAGLVTGPGGIAGHVWAGQWPEGAGKQVAPLLTRNVSGLTGACLIVTKEAFDSVGGFDEQHLAVSFNDLDLCLRMGERGLRHVLLPWCEVIHQESRTRARDNYDAPDKRFRSEYDWMRKRWSKTLDFDRFFPSVLRLDNMTPNLFWRGQPFPENASERYSQ